MLKANPKLEKIVKGILRYQEPLSLHTTFRLGGLADIFIIPSSLEEIQEIADYADQNSIPLHVIGIGSNLLMSDEGLRGIVLKIASPMDDISFQDDLVIAEAGAKCTRLIADSLRYQFTGLSFLSGIPGTIGGAVAMNAGTCGKAIGDILQSVWLYDRQEKQNCILYSNDLNFSYRESLLKNNDRFIVLQAKLQLSCGDVNNEILMIREKLTKRKESQPLRFPNAGCIWKNPPGRSTGKLIEDLGLKGFRNGRARISELHANFIVHQGRARAREVYELIELVEEKVFKAYGIGLEREIKLLGFGF
jgi:UDP-N-acetylmuramate dehydrogenase